MHEISTQAIIDAVKDSAIKANFELGDDVVHSLKEGIKNEESPVGKDILNQLIKNSEIARSERVPMCQDTGLAVIFAEIGQEVSIVGGDFKDALEEGIRQGYEQGFLRKSVCHPFTRKNTGDNTPIMTVAQAGPNPCPPTIVGVGIGGNFERSALLAKKALLRPLGTENPDPDLDKMEVELLSEINKTGIGPQGLGGRVTSLAVHVQMMPCHIASLPLAVNIQCHASRHLEIIF